MTAARELLDCLAEIGATVEPASDDRLILRAGPKPIPGKLVQQLREAKAEVLAALGMLRDGPDLDRSAVSSPAWWRRHFIIRRIDRELGGYRQRHEAERLAFNELVVEWHKRHGLCRDPRCCAGCGDELSDLAGIVIDRNGVRVHFDAARGDSCIIAYGQQWRNAAVAGLQALGIDPPEGFELL